MRKFLNYTISIAYTGITLTSSSLIGLFIQACSNGSDATDTSTGTPNATSSTNGSLANVTGDVHVLVRAISATTAMTTATATAASTPCGDMSTAGGFALVTVVLVVLGYPAVLTWFLLKKVRPRRFEVSDPT
jgi:hypothetical protein